MHAARSRRNSRNRFPPCRSARARPSRSPSRCSNARRSPMPSLKRPEDPKRIELPPRRAILGAETDVLVVGGGPAGLGAALGAAQAGARVVLAERYGFLCGNAAAALVLPLMSFHTQHHVPEKRGVTPLLPPDHGPGEAGIAGARAKPPA